MAFGTHPDWQFSCLVRNASKASDIEKKYSGVRVVQGDLDSIDLIEDEAAAADIVYHFANCDHTPSARAIAKGIARNRNSAAHWIHTSGAGILTFRNFFSNSYGFAFEDEREYNDWEGIGELTSLPDKALHRHVDKIVLATSKGNEDRIKTAIVAPPAIYGVGRGTGNTKTVQVHMAANLALRAGKALQLGNGSSIWHGVHVHDLSRLFLLLGEAALDGNSRATWNETGYYFADNGAFTWGSIMQAIANEGKHQGFLATDEVRSLSFQQAQTYHKLFPYLCGTTSRGVSKRAKLLLGWEPKSHSLKDEIPRIIRDEAQELGLKASQSDDQQKTNLAKL